MKLRTAMRLLPLGAVVCGVLVVWPVAPREGRAHQRYNDGCQTCHLHFTNNDPYETPGSGVPWQDDIERIHYHNLYMASDCDLCHTTGDNDNPYLGSSDGTVNTVGYGCAGCHGRDYGGATGVRAPGLRAHHAVTGANTCTATCHQSDPSPLPENVAPPYFGLADTDVNFVCNDDANTSEQWGADGNGLDNDGDGLYDLADPDCSGSSCGNGVVDGGETCDPCPASCDDTDTCTVDSMTGTPGNCDVVCSNTPITACGPADGCCPMSCNSTNDGDCAAVCGNGLVEAGETCDPCPTTCDDLDSCTVDVMSGAPGTCDVLCDYTAITACADGDGCCAPGCHAGQDDDCPPSCGDGIVDPGETCDPPASCPTDCDDLEVCTEDVLSGSVAGCTAECVNTPITACVDGDGCCAPGCDHSADSDCPPDCGNGVLDPGETCDPPASCPTTCGDGDACTVDTMLGSADTCDASCVNTPITECVGDDGCCPAGCTAATDNNCASSGDCGNGVVDPGETCDPPSSCPTACSDLSSCTADTLVGSAASCTAECVYEPIEACVDGDRCCPTACNEQTDSDCTDTGQGDDSGCGCRAAPTGAPVLWLLVVLGWLWGRRRADGRSRG